MAHLKIHSLPEEIIWFEPPTVCRWETLEETAISEKIENKTADALPTIAQPAMKRAANKTAKLTIVDFDLHAIPTTIDIDYIVKEIILPRVPDGYAFQLNEMQQSGPNQGHQKNVIDATRTESLLDYLVEIDSPRQLFPTPIHTVNFEVIERAPNKGEYLFSQLLKELDNLETEQIPRCLRPFESAAEVLGESISVVGASEGSEVDAMTEDAAVGAHIKEGAIVNQSKLTDSTADVAEKAIDSKSELSVVDSKSEQL